MQSAGLCSYICQPKTKPITRLSTGVFQFTRGPIESRDCLCDGLNAVTDNGNNSAVRQVPGLTTRGRSTYII
jgi:hypothetical protein